MGGEKIYTIVPFFGMPGSGKGSLCKALEESQPNFFHISTGDMFRYLKRIENSGQDVINKTLGNGKYVNDQLTFQKFDYFLDQLVIGSDDEFVQSILKGRKFIPEKDLIGADGLPRTLNQTIISDKKYNVPFAFYAKATEELCRWRMINLRKRDDDLDDHKRENRINEYLEKVLKPIIEADYYGERLITVDGNLPLKGMIDDFLPKWNKNYSSLLIHR